MISVEQALARVLQAFEPLAAEVVSLSEGLGRVLAEDLHARVSQPPVDVSAMDGYAVRAADVAKPPVILPVSADIPAGTADLPALAPGSAARIFTGAPMPAGADCVVIQEHAERDGDQVELRKGAEPGRYVRRAGLDFRAGDLGIAAGRPLTVRDLGLAAAMNWPWLSVRRRPRVGILTTGDELVLPGESLRPNQIISSNGFALSAIVTACGGEPVYLGNAPDRREALAAMARGAAGSDLIVTAGGASVGDHDLVREVLGGEGLEIDFWKIAMRPGKPLIFGRLRGTPLLGVPGNPVSALVCALLFLRPALNAMLGISPPADPLEAARLGAALPANDERQDYLRARLSVDSSGVRTATPFERQDSSMLATLAHSDCLIVRAPHAPPAAIGEAVEIAPFSIGTLQI